jgi:type 2 lantibiotic biosynthesis protein LanM
MNSLVSRDMKFSKEEMRRIVERSSTLQERLDGAFEPDTMQVDSLKNSERWEKWRAIVAGEDDDDLLPKRLEWDKIDPEAARSLLGAVRLAEEHPLPEWTVRLSEVMAAAALEASGPCRFLSSDSPIPFEEILVPFVDVAAERLALQAGRAMSQMSEQAYFSLKRSLLLRLALVCFSALDVEFSVFRVKRQQLALTSSIQLLSEEGSTELYAAFVRKIAQGGLKRFFLEYSVLARCTMLVLDLWVDASREFLERLVDDRNVIQRAFDLDDLGVVKDLRASLSDPHNGGRAAISVSFESGLQLIYKPKNLGVEKAYFDLLDWLNQHDAPLPLRVLKVIDCVEHGWVECCVPSPCEDSEEISRFYRRSGMLLCLVYALRGTDFHSENMIACGDQPVLVDLETLLTPGLLPEAVGGRNANLIAAQKLSESVISTYLLPQWQKGAGSEAISDRSGLGAVDSQLVEFRRLASVNTDRMALINAVAPLDAIHENSPFVSQLRVSLGDYIEDIVDGFSEMYQYLLRHRDKLLEADSPVRAFSGKRVRLVFRPTALYFAVLVRSLAPHAARDGAARSLEFDVLCRAFLRHDARPETWPLVAEERRALEQMDIPAFEFRSDSAAVGARGRPEIPKALAEPSYVAMRKRLSRLDEDDLRQQLEFIRGSLYSRLFSRSKPQAEGQNTHAPLETDVLSPRELVNRSDSIGQEICRRAIRGEDGSLTWISVNYDFALDRHQFSTMGPGLYAGTSGVALFLAALEKMRPTGEYRDASLKALQIWRQLLQEPAGGSRKKLIKRIGLGAGGGLAALVYAQVSVGQLLKEPELIKDAKQTAELITLEHIEADRNFDVMSGTAGVILALLKLYGATKDAELLSKADACGRNLLARRAVRRTGPRAWATAGRSPLTGFSHGAAGIAYALLRLFETSCLSQYLEAAREAIAYERTAFSPKSENWLDLRPNAAGEGEPLCMTSWCHGAPGIGLARVAGLHVLDDEDIRRDIETALHTTQRFGMQDVDHLCCGNLGRVDFLLIASRVLGRPELREAADKRAAWVVQRSGEPNAYQLLPNFPTRHFNPGLFQGLAGVGYELLRLVDAESLPSVLLLE